MKITQKGFTFIELMIVVAIISILAAISLPFYQNYTQRVANTACLAEAKSYIVIIIADKTLGNPLTQYTPKSCEKVESLNNSNIGDIDVDNRLQGVSGDITFTPHTRGNESLIQNTVCNTNQGICKLVNTKGDL